MITQNLGTYSSSYTFGEAFLPFQIPVLTRHRLSCIVGQVLGFLLAALELSCYSVQFAILDFVFARQAKFVERYVD